MIALERYYSEDPFTVPNNDYTPVKIYSALVQPELTRFIDPKLSLLDKITIATTVYDEFGDPLPGANIHIDGKPIASTYDNGSVTVPGIATSTSIIKITYVGMKDYEISAVFLPRAVRMQPDLIELSGVTIVIPNKIQTLTPPTTAVVPKPTPTTEPSKTNWLLWIGVAGIGFKVFQKMTAGTTVKAKI